MNSMMILSVCIIACAADIVVVPKDDHTADSLRSDLEEVKQRLECYVDEGPCSPVAEAYKSVAVDLITTKCAKCSRELLELCRAFLEVAKQEFPTQYEKLRIKYDPSDSYFDDLEKAVGCRKPIMQ